ncbi:MAG: MerR family transcriptional regulator [Oscillospiraceae bacterium]|nr:MerR family transcriptional regulator [Oscillospiraceae bacterium]
MESYKKENYLPIGKMAKANRVTIAALRLYDQMDLLKPAYIDEESGYRYYDIRQSSRLDFIRYMRDLGLGLSDISDLLQKEEVTLIEEKLIEKRRQVDLQLHELKATRDAIERTIHSIDRFRKSPDSGTISLEFIDRRYILHAPCRINFYETGIVAYEQTIQELRNSLLERDMPQILSYSLGTSVRKEDFEQGKFVADKVFIFGDADLKNYGDNVRVLESGMYACIYLDNFDGEIAYAEKLLDYCRAHGYLISGDYICEELTEFNIFDNSQRSMFLRLQIPVKFQKKT